MTRSHDFYREELDSFEEERQYYHQQMDLYDSEDNLDEMPYTEEELFRNIIEDEINDSE